MIRGRQNVVLIDVCGSYPSKTCHGNSIPAMVEVGRDAMFVNMKLRRLETALRKYGTLTY